jgi:RNA polymerase sigma factor (sigma-70 family)
VIIEEAEVRRLMRRVRGALWSDLQAFPMEADDMLAEGYLRMWESLSTWSAATGCGRDQWAMRAARWAARDYLRRARRWRAREAPLEQEAESGDWTGPLLDQWEAERLWATVWAGSSRLERRCLAAVYGAGLSSAAAGERLQLPASTVRHALQRVRQRARGAGQRSQPRGSDGCCPHGHRLTEENTYHRPNGKRACRICVRRQHRESWHRRQTVGAS